MFVEPIEDGGIQVVFDAPAATRVNDVPEFQRDPRLLLDDVDCRPIVDFELDRRLGERLAVLDDPSLSANSLGETPREEIDRARSAFEYHSDRVTITGNETLPDDVDVRATSLLSSVFSNLLDNAVFHNDKAEAKIDVSVERRESTVLVRIADNGPGISDSSKRRVFGRGRRASRARAADSDSLWSTTSSPPTAARSGSRTTNRRARYSVSNSNAPDGTRTLRRRY